jgi:hypothetical protein
MMGTIGCRYLVFASVYGRVIFWIMGTSLVVAGYLAYFWTAPPAIAAGIGGLIELTFAAIVFLNASKRVATSVGAV